MSIDIPHPYNQGERGCRRIWIITWKFWVPQIGGTFLYYVVATGRRQYYQAKKRWHDNQNRNRIRNIDLLLTLQLSDFNLILGQGQVLGSRSDQHEASTILISSTMLTLNYAEDRAKSYESYYQISGKLTVYRFRSTAPHHILNSKHSFTGTHITQIISLNNWTFRGLASCY